MGRRPCCDKVGLHRGAWSPEEDKLLIDHIQTYGEGQWRDLPAKAGLLRCGKSCRLRWVNYLRPGIKRGNFTTEENDTIIRLHSIYGSRWSLIAMELPGRTDNELKNHWNSYIRKAAENPDKLHTKNKKKSKKIKDGQTSKTQQPSTDVELVGTNISSSESSDKNESVTSSTCTSDFAPLTTNESGTSSSFTFDFGDIDCSFFEMDESSILEKLYLDYQSLIYNGDVNEENQMHFEF